MFSVVPWFIPKDLEKLFRYKVFKMLLSKKKITEDLIDMIMGWRHSGFNVFCGPRIQPGEEEAIENLACCIIRASFSQERMTYIPEESKVIYQSKDGKEERGFDALEWPRLQAGCKHSRPCAPMSRTRVNRRSVTMATIATFHGVKGKRMIKMA
jgi:hypothetical protein